MAMAGLRPLGHVREHYRYVSSEIPISWLAGLTLKMVWHRYSDIEFCIFSFRCAPYESCEDD